MNFRRFVGTFVALSLFSAASAWAEEPGMDEVTLKNGGSVRGTVVSSEPGTSVKILEVGHKEPRVIPWSQVSDVERGKYAPKAAAQPGPAGPGYGATLFPQAPQTLPPPEPKLGAPGVVKLHIESPVPVRIVEDAGTSVGAVGGHSVVIQHVRPVCGGTCDRIVDGSQGQAFAATGDFPSKSFSLGAYQGDVSLHVEPGSTGRRGGGLAMTSLGGVGVLIGVVMVPLAMARQDYTPSPTAQAEGISPVSSGPFKIASVATLAGSAALLAGGIALLATSGTSVKLEPGSKASAGKVAERKPRYWLGEF